MENQIATLAAGERRTLRSAISEGTQLLRFVDIESARLDAEVLLCHLLGIEKAVLYANIDAVLNIEQEQRFRELLHRRARREPVPYITGQKEFWSLGLIVTPDVLIPRPETELLVELVLERAMPYAHMSRLKILDLGTGSGAIAVSLAKELPRSRITAVDISSAALEVARRNSERHRVVSRIQTGCGDLFEPVSDHFDFIVSNPPYIRREELGLLPAEIHDWEPPAALDGGIDGLDYYRRIIAEAHCYLEPGGHLILEIGADMGAVLVDMLAKAGCYAPAVVYQDYAGRDRIIVGTNVSPPSVTAKGAIGG
jgi:release factor glutamine methyltransferase